jgi:hypothetical protein
MRVHLGRARRAVGDSEGARLALEASSAWHQQVGGGEQAALCECLLASLDAVNHTPRARDRLRSILDDAQRRDDAPVEVFALDALARLAAEAGDVDTASTLGVQADQRMEAACHFISSIDRVDALAVRALA